MNAIYNRDKPFVTIGTCGHVDNGKTTTTSVISLYLNKVAPSLNPDYRAFDTIDKAPEEKKRGITINTAFLNYQTEKRQYGHVDCPGHADYVKNMITGATQMDGAILVISSPHGLGVQDKEHIRLANTIGIKKMVVFMNKCDMVEDKELLELAAMEVLEFLTEQGYSEDTPFIYGSALKAQQDLDNGILSGSQSEYGIDKIKELMDTVDEWIEQPIKDAEGPLLLPVEDTFSIPGRGTAVAGRIKRGTVRKGDEIKIVNFGKEIATTVTSIESFNKSMDYAEANENPALLLRGVERSEVERGMYVVHKNFAAKQFKEAEVELYLLKDTEGGRKKPVFNNFEPQAFVSTANVTVTFNLMDGDMIMPGNSSNVKIKFHKPMYLEVGIRLSFREGGQTIANGIITKVNA